MTQKEFSQLIDLLRIVEMRAWKPLSHIVHYVIQELLKSELTFTEKEYIK